MQRYDESEKLFEAHTMTATKIMATNHVNDGQRVDNNGHSNDVS